MRYLLICFLFLFSNITYGNNESNQIIAIVNKNVLTSQSIEEKLYQSKSLEEKISIINKSIDLLIYKELIEKNNLNPSNYEIDRALEHIAKKNNLTIFNLKQSPNFAFIKNDITLQLAIFNLKVFITKDKEILISDNDINMSCKNINSKNLTKQIKISEIFISEFHDSSFNNPNKDSLIKKYLLKLSNHITKGASFTNLAKLHSQDQSYFNGGISEWKNLDTSFLLEIDKLPNNEVSTVYQKDNGWAIAIKIDERKVNLQLEECKNEISKLKAEKYFENYIINYKNEADITIFEKKL
jgi:peptidyl-prolyl cis-trans isomerase SurA